VGRNDHITRKSDFEPAPQASSRHNGACDRWNAQELDDERMESGENLRHPGRCVLLDARAEAEVGSGALDRQKLDRSTHERSERLTQRRNHGVRDRIAVRRIQSQPQPARRLPDANAHNRASSSSTVLTGGWQVKSRHTYAETRP